MAEFKEIEAMIAEVKSHANRLQLVINHVNGKEYVVEPKDNSSDEWLLGMGEESIIGWNAIQDTITEWYNEGKIKRVYVDSL